METVDVGVTAVYFYPPHPTPPTGLSVMLTHLQLQPTQEHIWHGRNCYLDWSQQEDFSQLRLTLFGGEGFGSWQEQWQQLANHHQQITCLGSTLVYWAVHEEGLAVVDWQPFVPTRFSFAEPLLVPRPETAVYLCHQSLGHHVYVALTRKEQTIHRRLIYNQTFLDLEQLWHQAERAKQAWLAEIDPVLLDRMAVLEVAIEEVLASSSRDTRTRLEQAYVSFVQQHHRVSQAERLTWQAHLLYKKKLWAWTVRAPRPLVLEMETVVSEQALLNLHNQVILCQQQQNRWWPILYEWAKASWRKIKWKAIKPILSIN